jgi:hypothetical protein
VDSLVCNAIKMVTACSRQCPSSKPFSIVQAVARNLGQGCGLRGLNAIANTAKPTLYKVADQVTRHDRKILHPDYKGKSSGKLSESEGDVATEYSFNALQQGATEFKVLFDFNKVQTRGRVADDIIKTDLVVSQQQKRSIGCVSTWTNSQRLRWR